MLRRILISIIFVSATLWVATACSGLNVAQANKPVVIIASPPSGSQFFAGDDVNVQSTSTDSTGVVRVELVVDSTTVAVDAAQSQPSFSVIQKWKAALGTHTIIVRAVNAAGATSDPVAVLVTVSQAVTSSATVAPTSVVPNATATSTASPTPNAIPTATEIPNVSATSAALQPPPPPPPVAPTCPGPPVISSFTASPTTITAGDSTTLSWGAVKNATSAVIDHGIGGVPTPGNKKVNLTSTTTYKMTATGCGGTATAEITVTVNPKLPVVVQVVSNKTSIPAAGGTGEAIVDCPSGTKATGGGFATEFGVFVGISGGSNSGSTPSNGWVSVAENDSSQPHDLQSYVICASNLSGNVHQPSQAKPANGNSTIGESSIRCPSGSIPTGGGFGAYSLLQYLSSSLLGGDVGWESSAINNGSATAMLFASAICYDGVGATSSSVVNSISVGANAYNVVTAACPSGTLLTGGGFRGDIGLIILGAGPYLPPTNPNVWFVNARNTTAVSKTLQAIAVCTKF